MQFTHASYMEYYASVEIFKFHRELETLYVDKFYDSNWQNSAIFYAGKSKDMPNFCRIYLKRFKLVAIYMNICLVFLVVDI